MTFSAGCAELSLQKRCIDYEHIYLYRNSCKKKKHVLIEIRIESFNLRS